MAPSDPYGFLGQQQSPMMNNPYDQMASNMYNGWTSSSVDTIAISPFSTTFTYEPIPRAGISGDPSKKEQRWLDRRIDEMRVAL